MNINRHNYEEFFLMYVDNELSAEDRRVVEQFITENPDLATELDLLAQATLLPEPVMFSNKDSLLKQEPIAPEIMEKMLLMLDGELDSNTANELKKQVQSTAPLQTEWGILQQTKLNASETIEFPDKAALYHHSTGRVISMRILRVAVAAAIIGFILYVGEFRIGAGSEPNDGMATTEPKQVNQSQGQNQKKENQVAGNDIGNKQSTSPASADYAIDNPSSNQKINNQSSLPNGSADANKVNNKSQQTDQLAAVGSEQKQNNKSLPANPTTRPVRNGVVVIDDNQVASSNGSEKKSAQPGNISGNQNVEPVNRSLSPERTEPNLIAGNNPADKQKEIKPLSALDTDIMQPLSVPDARVASLGTSDEKDPNEILFLDESKVKKSKLNGMFRKLKRTIARNTNIKTSNGVKIAGFEIAVR